MSLNFNDLASDIATALNHPGDITVQVLGFSHGIIEELTTNGMATSRNTPGPHSISGMTDSSMAALVASYAGYGSVSSQLLNFCRAIVDHIQNDGQVFYDSPVENPPLILPADAWYLNGLISNLDGSTLATLVASYVGYGSVSTPLLQFCTAVVNYIMANAEVTDGVIS